VVTQREWRNALLFAVVVMALTTLPYLVGASAQRSDLRFGWFLFGVDDGNSYLAKMRQGAVDGWLFHIVYTSEPHDGAFLFTPYLAGGKLAALLAPPSSPAFTDAMLLVFHLARIGFGILLILVTYRFVAVFIIKRSLRWLALTLITLGGGLGWLLTIVGLGNWLGSLPIDLYLPEGYTFYLLYGLPHLSLARAALLGGLLLIFRTSPPTSLSASREGESDRSAPLPEGEGPGVRAWLPHSLLAGLCWLIMGLCVPFYIAVLYVILGVWGIAAIIRYQRFPTQLFWRCVIGAIVSAPLLIYNFYMFVSNPIMGAWSNQNLLPSPHPLHYVFGYGVLAILAIPPIRWAWQRGKRSIAYLLLPAWVIAGPILAYLPINVQRRLLEGIFVPLCILATMGLRFWWIAARRSRRRVRWRNAVALVIALTLPTSFLLIFSGMLAVQQASPNNRLFHTEAEIAALDWLNTHAPPDSIVLSDVDTGNYIPARTSLRSYIGHGPETICLDAKPPACSVGKRDLVRRLFAGDMSAAERRALFDTNRIRYVIFPQGSSNTAPIPELTEIYNANGYVIYRVAR